MEMEMLLFIIPLLIIELALAAVAIFDLVKRERVKGGNKMIWALVVVFIGIIGPLVYLTMGREE